MSLILNKSAIGLVDSFHTHRDLFKRAEDLGERSMQIETYHQMYSIIDAVTKSAYMIAGQNPQDPLLARLNHELALMSKIMGKLSDQLRCPIPKDFLRLDESAQSEGVELGGKKFIHVAQFHGSLIQNLEQLESAPPPELVSGNKLYQKVIESQLGVVRIIRKIQVMHPEAFIFSESCLPNSLEDEDSFSVTRSKELFPEGIPEDFKLNRAQKRHIYYIGAAQLLHDLEEISAVYAVIHERANSEIQMAIQRGARFNIFDPREQQMLDCAEEILAQHPQVKDPVIVCIYGAGHDFSEKCAERGFAHEYRCSLPEMASKSFHEFLRIDRAFHRTFQEPIFPLPPQPLPPPKQTSKKIWNLTKAMSLMVVIGGVAGLVWANRNP